MFNSVRSKRSRLFLVISLMLTAILVLAACAPQAGANPPPAATATTAPPAPTDTSVPPTAVPPTATTAPASGVMVNTSTNASLGTFLVDSKGMTLYAFTKDTPGVSACTSAGCLSAWPILEATGDPVAGTGVTGKLGVITRSDGKKQVTINDMPLYYFAKDKAPGDTTGQDVGNVWYVVDGTGKTITTGGAAAPSATPAASSSSGGVMVNTSSNASLGTILVDSKGMTLYIFTKDTPGVSACTSTGCLSAWPILEATGDPVAGTGVTGKLGVITRSDGKKQVTINDMPLYYYAKDKVPGDITGQDVGNVWYVVDGTGKMVTTSGASSSSGVMVNTSTKDGVGTFLVDSKGMTLYVFTKDTPGVSACTSAGCMSSWPILEATGDPVAGSGVTGKLGVIIRPDGKKQVTINDMPLYYFASDKAAGDMNGQNVGNVWFMVDGTGKMITSAMAKPTATTSGY